MTGLLVLLGVLLMVLAAVLCGWWWVFPFVGIIAIIAGAVYGAWTLAKKVPTRRQAGILWRRHRETVAKAAVIMAIGIVLVVILWCLWARFAPKCTGGCWSATSPSVVTATAPAEGSSVTTPAGSSEVRVINVIAPTEGWSEVVDIPLFGELDAAADDRDARWEAMDASGRVYTFPSSSGEQTKTPPSGSMRFRSLESRPLAIKVALSDLMR